MNQATGFTTTLDFTVAAGVLATAVAVISALPPAGYASRLDPVNVMRTPKKRHESRRTSLGFVELWPGWAPSDTMPDIETS